MPCQKGNERRQKHHHEKRQASNLGRMPDLWHENVQNRQELGLLRHSRQNQKGWIFPVAGWPALLFCPITHNETAEKVPFHFEKG